jgi:hypothetical protein
LSLKAILDLKSALRLIKIKETTNNNNKDVAFNNFNNNIIIINISYKNKKSKT